MKKAKYEQWDLEDSLTKEEKAVLLRKELSRLLAGKTVTPAVVARMLRVLEQQKERGLIS